MYQMRAGTAPAARRQHAKHSQKPAQQRSAAQVILDIMTYVGVGSVIGAGLGYAGGAIHGLIDWLRDTKGRAYERVASLEAELAEAREELDRLIEAEHMAEENQHLDDEEAGDET